MEFKAFPSIERFEKATVTVTQKLHGSNASVWIYQDEAGVFQVKAGKRTSFIPEGTDNFGFAAYVEQHRQEFIEFLGPGIHFGEWCGPGINSGEGLDKKYFVLFDTRMAGRPLPTRCRVVPLLWQGRLKDLNLNELMTSLKNNGSYFVQGFARPEGVVVRLDHTNLSWKHVFEDETTQWRKGSKTERPEPEIASIAIDHLLQPIRLEKLLSRDEKYLAGLPKTLSLLASDYVADLIKENEIQGDDDQITAVKKALGKKLFGFIKAQVTTRV